jgi:hypothetical protein
MIISTLPHNQAAAVAIAGAAAARFTEGHPASTSTPNNEIQSQTSIKLIQKLARVECTEKGVMLPQAMSSGQPSSSERAQVLDFVNVRLHWHVPRCSNWRTANLLGLHPGDDSRSYLG